MMDWRKTQKDCHAPDGMFYTGWRVVREGGHVKAGGCWFRDDSLIPFVGNKVFLVMGDYWMNYVTAYAAWYDVMISDKVRSVERKKSCR